MRRILVPELDTDNEAAEGQAERPAKSRRAAFEHLWPGAAAEVCLRLDEDSQCIDNTTDTCADPETQQNDMEPAASAVPPEAL
eukprot:11199341-Lingulodinium_polyedra.AAC.1